MLFDRDEDGVLSFQELQVGRGSSQCRYDGFLSFQQLQVGRVLTFQELQVGRGSLSGNNR